MPDMEEVTLGEIYRMVVDIRANMVNRDENNARLENITRTIGDLRQENSGLKVAVAETDQKSQRRHEKAESDINAEALARRAANQELAAKIESLRDGIVDRERADGARRNGLIVTGGIAAISLLITIFKGVLGIP